MFVGFAGNGHAKQTSISMHGTPKYEKNFTYFSYVNPMAPKGGNLRLSAVGSYDSLNPFLIKGTAPQGLGLVYQSLLTRSRDEPFSLYANIAKFIEVAPDRKWIIFTLDQQARFSDGSPIRVEDVLYSFETLKSEGRPNHRQFYANVEQVTIVGASQIRFEFKGENTWEMPLIMGLMPVLSKAHFEISPFNKTSLIPPLGSGPYHVKKIQAGRQITYRRNPKFWGWHLPQYKGRYNFDTITFDYFRDSDVAREAFKAGYIDARFESDPGKWDNAYSVNKETKRSFFKEEKTLKIPAPMRGLVFNTRRKIFRNINTRRALTLAYDFEWVNKNLLYGKYQRTHSYFENSDLAATATLTSEERTLLNPFRSELPASIFKDAFSLPVSNGSGRDRNKIKAARQLLEAAGWTNDNGKLIAKDSDKPFRFEILIQDKQQVKFLSAFQKNLERLGISSFMRIIDSASYQNRLTNYDFDMIIGQWGQSLSPGNEQSFYWSSVAAETPGTRNYPGIKLKSVDYLISQIRTAKNRETLELHTRALDRVLLFNYFVIPLYHTNKQWIIHWPSIQMPEKASYYGTGLDVWWHSPID